MNKLFKFCVRTHHCQGLSFHLSIERIKACSTFSIIHFGSVKVAVSFTLIFLCNVEMQNSFQPIYLLIIIKLKYEDFENYVT